MHWFSIPFDNLMYSIITCPTENFGVKVIFESATSTHFSNLAMLFLA